MNKHFYKKLDGWPAIVAGVLILGSVAYYGYVTYQSFEVDKASLLAQVEEAQSKNYTLIKMIQERDKVIESFQGQIGSLSNTLGTLEKLAITDEELLKKYSKVYFLNENYVPPSFADIDEEYLLPNSQNFLIYAKVWPYLRDLLRTADAYGHHLLVASAYRSFGTQAALKNSYTVTYGTGANKFSADQGYSEHQLGTAVDLTTGKLGAAFSQFGSDPVYLWLTENAHRYGFILSYPESNTYYKFEPWHWRFVGVELATKLHSEKKSFYDMDQREIDKYLIKLFE